MGNGARHHLTAVARTGAPAELNDTAETRTVAGVTLTQNDLGYHAASPAGLIRIEAVDGPSAYWDAWIPGRDEPISARTLGRLVGQLVRLGHLTKAAS